MEPLTCWLEWKTRCAADLCTAITRQLLHAFAYSRFIKFFPCSAPYPVAPSPDCGVSAAQAWHLFETYLVTTQTRQGKCYKDWLFARVAASKDDAVDVIQGGATLIMRSVVRRHIHDEYPRKGQVSLHTVVSERGGQTLTLEDLLATGLSPAAATVEREYNRLARIHAAAFFSDMPGRERVMLLAKALGMSLANPTAISAAGCAKSTMCLDYHRFMRRVAASLVELYPGEETGAVMQLTLLTVLELKKLTITWGKAEKRCAGFFLLTEGDAAAKRTTHGTCEKEVHIDNETP